MNRSKIAFTHRRIGMSRMCGPAGAVALALSLITAGYSRATAQEYRSQIEPGAVPVTPGRSEL